MKIQTMTDAWLRSNLLDAELNLLSIFFCIVECKSQLLSRAAGVVAKHRQMIDRSQPLNVKRQAKLLNISRGAVYFHKAVSSLPRSSSTRWLDMACNCPDAAPGVATFSSNKNFLCPGVDLCVCSLESSAGLRRGQLCISSKRHHGTYLSGLICSNQSSHF